MDAISGTDPFIMMADGRGWLFSPSGLLDGPLPTLLRAARVADRQPPLPGGGWQSGRDPLAPTRESISPGRRPAVSARGDDVPADRASHRGRDEPHRPVARRAPARDVCRDRSAARRRPRHRGRRLDDDHDRAGGDRGAGEGHRPHPPHQGGRASDPPGGAAVALGLQRALTWRHRQRARRAVRRSERLDPGRQGVHLRRARRPPVRREHRAAGRRRARRASRPPERGRPVGGESRQEAIRDELRRAPRTPRLPIHRAPARSAWASSPTPRCASAARPARSRASSGTTCPPTARRPARASPTTTPGISRPRPGATSGSSSCSSPRPSSERRRGARSMPAPGVSCRRFPAAGGLDLVDAAQPAPDVVDVAEAVRKMGDWVFMSDVCKHCTNAGCLDACPTGALSAPSIRRSCCSPTSVTAAATACRRVRSGCRSRPRRRPRRQMHALLRPSRGRARAGLREVVPDRLDPVRPPRGVGGDRLSPRRRAAFARHRGRLPVRSRRRARRAARRRPGLVLPVDRAARALRLARRTRTLRYRRTSFRRRWPRWPPAYSRAPARSSRSQRQHAAAGSEV